MGDAGRDAGLKHQIRPIGQRQFKKLLAPLGEQGLVGRHHILALPQRLAHPLKGRGCAGQFHHQLYLWVGDNRASVRSQQFRC